MPLRAHIVGKDHAKAGRCCKRLIVWNNPMRPAARRCLPVASESAPGSCWSKYGQALLGLSRRNWHGSSHAGRSVMACGIAQSRLRRLICLKINPQGMTYSFTQIGE